MWKYCRSIFQLGFFIFYIIFLSFISFSSIHVSFLFFLFLFLIFLLHTSVQCPVSAPISISPSFIFFFTLRTFQQPHLLHIRERERELLVCRPTVDGDRGCRKDKAGGDWHSPYNTTTSAAHPPPYHQAGLDRLVLFFFFFFFIFACSNSTLF